MLLVNVQRNEVHIQHMLFLSLIKKMKTYDVNRDLETGPQFIMCWEWSQLVFQIQHLVSCYHSWSNECNKSTTIKTQELLDYSASTCFVNKELVQQHKLALVKKVALVEDEAIDDHSFFSRLVTHETKALEITIGSHSSKVMFNVVMSKTQSSLGYFSSFSIIHMWINIQKVSILKHPSKNLWIVRPLSQAWLVKHMNLYVKCSKKIWVRLNINQISKTLLVHKNPSFPNHCLWTKGIHTCCKERGCILDLCTSHNRCQSTTTWDPFLI
jgi:hypothetical protein